VKPFRTILLFACAAIAPAKAFACAACYGGNVDSPMTSGMNWAILTLGVIVATVLGGFLFGLVYLIRKSEALTAAAEKKNSPEASTA